MQPPLSASLPSHFRIRPLEDFFARSAHDESPAPTVDTNSAKTRLEVLHGWEVNFTVLSLYFASILALLYVIVKLHSSRTTYDVTGVMPGLTAIENAFRIGLNVSSVMLALFFLSNLALHPNFSHEQAWTCVLLLVGLAADNPFTRSSSSTENPHRLTLVLNDAIYTAAIYLYLILAAHSYRVFDARNIRSLRFYMPKLLAATGYLLVKLVAGFKADVSLGLVPYARVLTWLYLEQNGRGTFRVSVPVLLITALDAAFSVWLVHEVAATTSFLATVPYVEHRSKQLGFRCFVYQSLAFCLNMIGLSLLISYLTPRKFLFKSFDNPKEHFFQLEPPVARLSLAFVYFTWTLNLAYVNLPPRPLMMPFAQRVMQRCLFLVRNSRVAVWMGLADIVTAEDDEDSSDDDVPNAPATSRDNDRVFQTILDTKPNIPFRYRHRELFDEIVLSPNRAEPIMRNEDFSPWAEGRSRNRKLSYEDFAAGLGFGGSPLSRRQPSTMRYSDLDADDPTPEPSPELLSQHWTRPSSVPTYSLQWQTDITPSVAIDIPNPRAFHTNADFARHPAFAQANGPPQCAQRHCVLRMRKHLFVMETQIMMANASYLSYIPGNENEERVPSASQPLKQSRPRGGILHTGSLATDLNDLARQIEEENEAYSDNYAGGANLEEDCAEPDHDDGTMFLVDPYKMAERHGYRIHRHISNEELNTHAVVLINSSRVIVAFSGTRNVKNWGVNANINRAVLDDKLSRFEYELNTCPESINFEATDTADDDNVDNHGSFELHETRFRHHAGHASQSGKLRLSRSEEDMRSYSNSGASSESLLVRSLSTQHYGGIDWKAKSTGTLGRSIETEDENGLITRRSVTRMAKTFARELMTFGQPKVHEGFIDAYMSLRKQVMGTLVELYRGRSRQLSDQSNYTIGGLTGPAQSLPLFFCGHSMGGALATFASYEAARYYKRIGLRSRHIISCATFGCPRIGNEAFKARYERLVETHWRFEIASDPIPKVPLVLLNYVHVGVQVLVDQSGMLLIDPSFIEVQWWGRLANLYLGYRLHIRASYCMALRTYCKRYKSGTEDLGECFWPFPIRVQTKGLFQLGHP